MKARYCGNSYDPRLPDASMHVVRSLNSQPGQDVLEWYGWLNGKILGPPESTDTYTREQLQDMNLVSVWMIDGPDDGLTKMADITLGTDYQIYESPISGR